ncbi:MAG: hypothetical protein P4L51_12115 [Puia sp.]|nr:hypothetical protein [Puia sp.]
MKRVTKVVEDAGLSLKSVLFRYGMASTTATAGRLLQNISGV